MLESSTSEPQSIVDLCHFEPKCVKKFTLEMSSEKAPKVLFRIPIRTMNEKSFDQLHHLESLTLTHYDIDLAWLSPLTKLQRLSLRNCSLTNLDAGQFAEKKQLIYLNLGGCDIEKIEPDLFTHCGRLETLILDFNRLKHLHKDTFKPLMNLEVLSLSENRLPTIEPDLFACLPNLRSLELDGNAFRTLDSHLFDENKKLRDLCIGMTIFLVNYLLYNHFEVFFVVVV